MSARLQARGPGLCPVNVEGCATDALVGFLERDGYTDIRMVATKAKEVPDAPAPRRTTVPSTRRVVTRRPRA